MSTGEKHYVVAFGVPDRIQTYVTHTSRDSDCLVAGRVVFRELRELVAHIDGRHGGCMRNQILAGIEYFQELQFYAQIRDG